MIIKVSRKWRITSDENNWIIQERKWKQKPPNDWVNKYFFTEIESLPRFLLDLQVRETDLKDLDLILSTYKKLSANLRQSIRELIEKTGGKLPETKKKKALKERSSKSVKSKEKKKEAKKPRVGGKKKARTKK